MWLKLRSRPGAVAAVLTVANVVYLIAATSAHQPKDWSGVLVSQLLADGSLADVLLALAALVLQLWSAAIILLSFAALLFWLGAGST